MKNQTKLILSDSVGGGRSQTIWCFMCIDSTFVQMILFYKIIISWKRKTQCSNKPLVPTNPHHPYTSSFSSHIISVVHVHVHHFLDLSQNFMYFTLVFIISLILSVHYSYFLHTCRNVFSAVYCLCRGRKFCTWTRTTTMEVKVHP